jgi:pimeloyl-ACP methyl ester carboxylesterase
MQITGSIFPEPTGSAGISIRAPGRTGTATSVPPGTSATRGARRDHIQDAVNAMADPNLGIAGRIDIKIEPTTVQRPAVPDGTTRSDPAPPPAIVVSKRDDQTAYAVHYFDEESGADIWVFPIDPKQTDLTFELPEAPPSASQEEPGGTRGAITAAMRGLVTVVAWVTDAVVSPAAKAVAKAWEDSRRPYGLFQVKQGGELVGPDWSTFDNGPTLLLIHGTFSTPGAGFDGWINNPAFAEINKRYGGRCLALAHPTMHADPAENIAWLMDHLPKDKQWNFDTVSHSRGGLVVRELAAHANQGESCRVNKLVMVAPPNFGTPLADADHWTTFLNAHTTILTYAPDTVATIVTEGLLCLVKILGGGVARGLPGIAAMNVEAKYLQELASRAYSNPAGLFAVAANYSPSPAIKQILAKVGDKAVDSFFGEPNDMVVPTKGCSEGPLTSSGFPIPRERLLSLSGQVHHCNMFEQKAVHEKFAEWLA